MLQVLGLTLLRLGSTKRISVMTPPKWATQNMQPYTRESSRLPINAIGKLGAWVLLRGNRLASITNEQGSIKVIAP